ncbi:hypothetical protein JRO89_XS11G0059300 [Xanthoceras sorbifolium]|uniref:Strictosidine synthase conserved region domain-containing protein n=1 Tax=Xanthoceras sorbifolium TaxID=99658 RepID=A0ABQ8HET0_9ROSI|nr:hypothetical protein JRO89_XS11G0059300 [Xanthoceras sorbifolium]
MSSRLIFSVTLAVFLFTLITVTRINLPSQKPHVKNLYGEKSRQLEVVPIEGGLGPESFAFDHTLGGGPYTGVSEGRIIKWEENERRWINFAVTSQRRDGCEGGDDDVSKEDICGRPLGMRFNKRSDLYVADAYMGLLRVGPEGGLATSIATQAQGIPFRFCNGLDIDHSTGLVYFTDSSSLYQRRNYMSVILSGDRTGRLMKYDPDSQKVSVLVENLSFPNGIVLSQDGNYILLAETTKCRILKYWLKTSKAASFEVFAELPGFPDNIKMSPRGGFWVGIHSRRHKISEWALSYSWIGNALLKLPIDIIKLHSKLVKLGVGGGMAVRLNEDGEVLEILQGKLMSSVSEVGEKEGTLWIGSVNMPFAGMYKT